MDDQMQASIGADLEVERRLDDFARARLTPGADSKARSRARVMREARLAFADWDAQRAAASENLRARAASRRTAIRRGAGLLLAAGLSLVVVGGALAASGAGGPLYGSRLWLETIMLPADADARVAAEIARLDARLADVEAAVRAGDRAAVAAALSAYQAIADEALSGASGDATAIARLLAALDRHLAVLERVATQVPPQAADSIDRNITRAIQHSDAAIERIQSKPAQPSGGGGPAAKPQPVANPTTTPSPTPKPRPAATPKASPKAPPAEPSTPPAEPSTPPAEPDKPDKAPPGRADH
jgi:hypothetical protein